MDGSRARLLESHSGTCERDGVYALASFLGVVVPVKFAVPIALTIAAELISRSLTHK